MKLLLKGGSVVNVFADTLDVRDVLIEDGKIIGVGSYTDSDADEVRDVSGKYIAPGFIDAHIHIESTMLSPAELASVALMHGTTSIVADPHEIANVSGTVGIDYMLEASEGLPLNVYLALPSCVPATPFDESYAELGEKELEPYYSHERVVGLAEMMNYPGVIFDDAKVHAKIKSALSRGKVVDGHAPSLSGKDLNKYVSAGIMSDHECTTADEAKEKLALGQRIMIREGTAARNLDALLPLFDGAYSFRCLLATDDRHPEALYYDGEIDNIIRRAVKMGKSPLGAIRMATVQPAEYFKMQGVGAIAPGYRADILVLDELDTVKISEVYSGGRLAVKDGKTLPFEAPEVSPETKRAVMKSFNVDKTEAKDFYIEPKAEKCRVIEIVRGELLTKELILPIAWDKNNGIDTEGDILKLAVIERHRGTGHKGVGFIKGIGLREGAIASSVSHDSHNLIVIGASDSDMAIAANRIIEIGGGNVVVRNGEIVAEMALPIGGLMSEHGALRVAEENAAVRDAVYRLGVYPEVSPFMNMAFVSLTVIPDIKMSTKGLVSVSEQKLLSLYAD